MDKNVNSHHSLSDTEIFSTSEKNSASCSEELTVSSSGWSLVEEGLVSLLITLSHWFLYTITGEIHPIFSQHLRFQDVILREDL